MEENSITVLKGVISGQLLCQLHRWIPSLPN